MANFSLEFTVKCGAPGIDMGVVLMQAGRPVAYARQGLKGRALTLSTYENEMIAILWAINKWRQHLIGRRFVIETDQKSSKFLLIKEFERNPNVYGSRS